jgi:heme oxygenase
MNTERTPESSVAARASAEHAPLSAPTLHARLRESTAAQHRDTESRSFISALMGGDLALADYVRYLAQYAYVYRALEAREAQPGDPALVDDARLHRFPAIASDLIALGAADWECAHLPLPATAVYVDRLTSLAPTDVPRYLAHHYTRYLGDLSGGQAIASLVARHYGATADQLSFYRFEAIDNPAAFKREYREGINTLDFDEAQAQALIAEAQAAFDCNAAIFDELGQASAPVH